MGMKTTVGLLVAAGAVQGVQGLDGVVGGALAGRR